MTCMFRALNMDTTVSLDDVRRCIAGITDTGTHCDGEDNNYGCAPTRIDISTTESDGTTCEGWDNPKPDPVADIKRAAKELQKGAFEK